MHWKKQRRICTIKGKHKTQHWDWWPQSQVSAERERFENKNMRLKSGFRVLGTLKGGMLYLMV